MGSDTMHDAQWCAVRADHPDVFVNGDARRARVVDPPRPQERLSAGDGARGEADIEEVRVAMRVVTGCRWDFLRWV